ncbi:ret finger protein-like 4B [Cricetulus griseus]|uniref:Ret finger protein-like 4B n=2 Tax=Cricetulus griseus TaxID=10029 RepID=A0A9J7FJC3_CRIGR|nr:ret finger protein-like 4B [Cricetulus griseus]XP_027258064.2 ret finger protein-like 4B [Cricetulus griseus]
MVVLPEMWALYGSLEVEAVCPICLDFYSRPIYLSCAHVFCFDCAENWMARKEDLILTCPMCREENKRPVVHEWVIRELIILIKQHGSLLKQQMGQITGLLRLCAEAAALEADTGDSSLVLSDDLRHVCWEKPGHSLVEDPPRFIPLASVLDSSHFSSVCQEVDAREEKEWTPDVCKEPVSRRNDGHNLVEDPRRFSTLACVLDSSHIYLVCQEVDAKEEKEWTPTVCKEPVSRRNLGHNLVEDPRRFIPLACVLDSSHIYSVCQEVDVGEEKEWIPTVCKEPVSRRNHGRNLEDPRTLTPQACILDSCHICSVWHWEIDRWKGKCKEFSLYLLCGLFETMPLF